MGRFVLKAECLKPSACRLFRHFFHLTFSILLTCVGLAGCSHVMHPEAAQYLEQAKGSSGIETLINLTVMMSESVEEARSKETYQHGLDKLHDQFHALHDAFCRVNEVEAAEVSYIKAATIEREMRAVFHRLWKYREDHAVRGAHLDLFAKRLLELRETLQEVKA